MLFREGLDYKNHFKALTDKLHIRGIDSGLMAVISLGFLFGFLGDVTPEKGRLLIFCGILAIVLNWFIRSRVFPRLGWFNLDSDYYRYLFNLSTDLICIATTDGSFKMVNPQFEATLGYTTKELKQLSWLDLIHPEDVEKTQAEASRFADKNHVTHKFVNRYRTKSGKYRYLSWAATKKSNSKILFCIIQDVTEEYLSNHKLQESERFLTHAQEVAKIGHWLVDLEQGEVRWSKETYRIHGVSEEFNPNFESAISFFPNESKAKITQAFDNCVQKGIPYDLELDFLNAQGQALRVRAIGQPEFRDGKIVQIFGVFQDVTLQYHSQQKLEEAKEAAEEAVEAKSAFLSTMSHEIRTPLNAIIGSTHLVSQAELSPDNQEMIDIIRFSGENLMTLVNDILDFSKIEAGKVRIETTSVNLRQVVEAVCRGHEIKAKDKLLDTKVQIGPGVPEVILGDPVRLTQVLNNLLGNAIKFTEEGSVSIVIHQESATKEAAKLRFEIQDTGIGISEKAQAEIFSPFTQASVETTRKYGGTGLGLAISRNLIRLMGGELWLKSKLDHGSTFGFSLEFEVAENLAKHGKSESSLPHNTLHLSKNKILIVEDNLFNYKIAKKILEKWGALNIDHAENGQEAIDMTKAKEYDLILMDIRMPVLGGVEATQAIRTFNQWTPIIAFSASVVDEKLDRLAYEGFNDFVAKPVNPQRLQRAIEQVLRMVAKY